jgi:hypothetical protein
MNGTTPLRIQSSYAPWRRARSSSGQRRVVPGVAVDRVDAVDLHATRIDQRRDRVDHALVLVVPAAASLRREGQQRAPVVAVGDHAEVGAQDARVDGDVPAVHVATAMIGGGPPLRIGASRTVDPAAPDEDARQSSPSS